jgi:hypothetical protein
MRNRQVFKRQGRSWVVRPTGGADPTPAMPPRVAEWLKSDFACRLINKSVGQ